MGARWRRTPTDANLRVEVPKMAKPSSERVTVQNVNVPGYTSTVDATMYNAARAALLKALPKGKMRELPIEASYIADDNKLSFRTAGGVKLDVKAVEGHPANWPKWQDKLPKHGEYNEVVVDGKRLKKLVSDAVAQDNALGKSKQGKGYQPKVVLRVSAKPDHPFEIHSSQGVKGFLMPMTDEVKHDRPKRAGKPASTALSAGETAKV
jgi:hypothetical protein